jgi:polysaccharide biosynthesis transport protein
VESTKDLIHEIRQVAKRRKRLLLITPILFLIISIVALQYIEPKYRSSTSILVQKEEVLNPLLMYEMAIQVASEDRLTSFNEIIYSRSTIEFLVDSLRMDQNVKTEAEKQRLIERVRKNIRTGARSSDSFEITFYDNDPVRARDAVELLANRFITTRLHLEGRRNNETVNFFTTKLDELEQTLEQQRDQLMSQTSAQISVSPIDKEALQTRLQGIDSQMDEVSLMILRVEDKLAVINEFLAQTGDEESFTVRPLYRLSLDEIPFGGDLSGLLTEYDGLNQQFTASYPRLRALRIQITDVVSRIPSALNSNMSELERRQANLRNQREQVIRDMEQHYVATQQGSRQQSSFNIYQELYNEMKVKLEQAKVNRDIGSKASEQFMVLDAPYIPENPASPNKKLVVGGGFFAGIFFGILFVAFAEVLDNTIRREEDLEIQKPIIAYLGAGTA